MFFGGAWIFGGWWAVEWVCKSYLGPAEIVSFSRRSFWQLNEVWFTCETLHLFFLIIFYYISIDQQSSADFLQNRCSYNFADFTGQHLCWILFWIKLQSWKDPPTQMFSCQISKILKNTFFKEHLRWLLLYILYTNDVTYNLSRWNNGYNSIYKKDQKKLKRFEKVVFWNTFYIIYRFLSLCVFISVQNIGRRIPWFLSWLLLDP